MLTRGLAREEDYQPSRIVDHRGAELFRAGVEALRGYSARAVGPAEVGVGSPGASQVANRVGDGVVGAEEVTEKLERVRFSLGDGEGFEEARGGAGDPTW